MITFLRNVLHRGGKKVEVEVWFLGSNKKQTPTQAVLISVDDTGVVLVRSGGVITAHPWHQIEALNLGQIPQD
jgi:hypothetical protein